MTFYFLIILIKARVGEKAIT